MSCNGARRRSPFKSLFVVAFTLTMGASIPAASQPGGARGRLSAAISAWDALRVPVVMDLSTDAAREQTVWVLEERSRVAKEAADAVAREKGWPIRGVTSEGVYYDLRAITENGPLYDCSTNVNAAISTAADQIRQTAPYSLDGTGVTVAIWESGGVVRATHQEFGVRVNVIDDVGWSGHATHVGGTVGAVGIDPNALGMAPNVAIDAYDSGYDISEMTAVAATGPGQSERIYLSNHSYGTWIGWYWASHSGTEAKHWFGTWGQREDAQFGQYNVESVERDTVCYAAPYYLPFWSSGNSRGPDQPAEGETFGSSAICVK